MTLRTRLLGLSLMLLCGCSAAALASVLGVAAPIAGNALGAYARAADDAQRAADIGPADPLVVALRRALADLAAADARVAAAQLPVECVEPVPVGAPLPPPAVDTAALDAALDARIARAVDARAALGKVPALHAECRCPLRD